MNVGAKDKNTGKEQNIVIQSSGGLSEADIQAMVNEAEKNADLDKQRKAVIEAKNEGDHEIYNLEKNLVDHGDKVSNEIKDSIKEKISALKKAMEGNDAEEIKSKKQEMMAAAQKIGEAIYNQKKEGDNNETKDENVMDAEFKEKDEKTKSA